LGYSVPTSFAGTEVPVWEFSRWPIHLLGGSPSNQLKLARYLDVRSADGNYAQKLAISNNQFFAPGKMNARNRSWPQLQESCYGNIEKDTPYFAFELSCINIRAAWNGCQATIRWASEDDLPAIKRIANQYKNELGYVMWPALREAITLRELYAAEYQHRIVGFCHFHKRRDGWFTIYEVAVDKARRGEHIGRALVESVPLPRRLKCTVDNRANDFYEHIGGECVKLGQGRKRMLYTWQWGHPDDKTV
jgi:GNAT superfamily N-acetyltransferase